MSWSLDNTMKTLDTLRRAILLAGMGLAMIGAAAQGADQPATRGNTVELSFPENLPLKVLIDYVGKRQGVNFIYDANVVSKKITIKAPRKVPSDSLMTLLESALKMSGMVMSPTGVKGMMRIEVARELTAISKSPQAVPIEPSQVRPTLATTRVFQIEHANPARIERVLKPFLSAATANFTALPEHGLVIITDYATNMKRLENLVALVDRPKRKVSTEFIRIQHVKAESISKMASQLISGKAKARGGETPGKLHMTESVTVLHDERTNRVVVIGPAGEVEEAVSLIKSLDVATSLNSQMYKCRFASPQRVDRLVKEMIGEFASDRLYESVVDPDSNLLIAKTTPEIHARIRTLHAILDKPAEERQSPIRFYKLENAKAADVMFTLQNIEGESGLGGVSIDGASGGAKEPEKVESKGPTGKGVNQRRGLSLESTREKSVSGGAVQLRDARVMADEPSNTIIVIATPSTQTVYEKLIKRLDVRRPQVLVEATIVTVNTTDGFKLGVDISRNRKLGDDKGNVLTFSSFGLSKVDAGTGRLTLDPGVGFNGALLSADIADLVIQALDSDSRAKVVARPSVLLNDNSKGELVREREEPFKSINAFTSGTTTESFAGYASAGTRIMLEPQISQGDHLKLAYEITLSSFSFDEEASETLPPSRQTNSLKSEVTIPDGYTILVGGLTREEFTRTVDRVPLLGKLPILEYAFSNRSRDKTEVTLFVFLRAVILRDDKFKDLKQVSDDAARDAELSGEHPVGEPLEVR